MPTSLTPILDQGNRPYSDSNPPETLMMTEYAGAVATPSAGKIVLYSPDGTALLWKDDAGVVRTVAAGGTKTTDLTAASALTGTEVFPAVQGGTTKKVTASQINTFVAPVSNASIAAQTLGTGDTYLTRSNVVFAAGRLQAGSFYRAVIDMTKTAAGTATAVVNLRFGTAGTTADTVRCVFTFPTAQTAAIDNARFTVNANMRVVGASAVVQGVLIIERTNTTTGFLSTGGLQFMAPIRVTSGTFDSTTVTNIGVSINAGAASAWTTQLVQASIENLV